ncbi:hypothetical protein EJ05DRAFT_518542 [Pseudovirgaria hyperparasitica]|uniref:Lysine-specific metallo-endopeptidase domain-containing protein n=1 Tax=Pseudovirgaria hyperparasitica TaxID=470096 RepID=A0A6A6W086_9PEZI|nr:uncharacterized protein EJ05DRAFT_518542 [Pseudovirgaria hyperparasitica]KAF2755953.1 hypothetical protein EJ05DRAFT_518542 [Pseudovirgaria hyperparasitica]
MVMLLLVLLLSLLTLSSARTYAWHESCDKYSDFPGVKDVMDEVIRSARLAHRYLELKDSPPGIDRAFRRMFDPRDPSAYESTARRVASVMRSVTEMRPSPQFFDAEALFYCDNDKRWKIKLDQESGQSPLQEMIKSWRRQFPSLHTKKDEEIIERLLMYSPTRVRGMVTFEDAESGMVTNDFPGCMDPEYSTSVGAIMYRDQAPSTADTIPESRNTLTLCDAVLKSGFRTMEHYVQEATKNDPHRVLNLQVFEADKLVSFLSLTLLHELMHVLYTEIGDEKYGTGWTACQQLPTSAALINAESYAYFGILALLFEMGYELSSSPREAYVGKLVKKTS